MSNDEERDPKVLNAPESIWLCYGDMWDGDAEHDDLCRHDDQVTWCDAQQDSADVRYVRADLHDALRAEVDYLKRYRFIVRDLLAWYDNGDRTMHELDRIRDAAADLELG